MQKIYKAFLFCLILLSGPPLFAQKGQYLMLWGGPQQVSLNNYDDYNVFAQGNKLDRVNTYRMAFGVDYINNFSPLYGFQTGLTYSQQGQKYSGLIHRDFDTHDSQIVTFKSHVYLNYYRIPLMFRFNSGLETDQRMNMSLFFGFQVGVLGGVQEVVTDALDSTGANYPIPDSVLNRYPNFDFNKLYKKVDVGIGAGVQFNIKINSTLSAHIGARFDRSLGTIENLGYNFPKDIPAEYVFPVSTKKESFPDLLTRNPTKNTVVNVFLGIGFRIAKPKE